MSKIIDLEEYRRKKLLQTKDIETISNEELFSILVGVMSEPLDQIEEEAERDARKDFEKYEDDAGTCRCLFCGSVLLGKDDNEN